MVKNNNYRLGVGAMIINANNMVFVGKRSEVSNAAWQMPQGGVDEGEIPTQAIMRELEEEIGTNKVELIAESKKWYYYDIPEEIVTNWWSGKYVGQKQKWFLAKFLGQDHEININTLYPEFVDWKWVDVDTLPSLVVPFKKKLYEDLIQEFQPLLIK